MGKEGRDEMGSRADERGTIQAPSEEVVARLRTVLVRNEGQDDGDS
jgi:hypothetical protein